jgi:hypothetical protein
MVVGILALVFYNDLAVKDYFSRLNDTVSVPPAPVPMSPALPETEPVAPAEPVLPAAPEAPQPEVTPEKPKRIRKVAGK